MNSPYYKRFKITQSYKGYEHDGLDLVGIDSKEIHSTINGVVTYANWENENNHNQGFGKYIQIKEDGTDRYFYFGHLSQIYVRVGEHVSITQVIGIEGSTGYSTGSHCHYCCRRNGLKGQHLNINEISGIPNNEGGIYDDGYRVNIEKPLDDYVEEVLNNKYGIAEERKQKLGNNYNRVQNRVNEYYNIADDVIEGIYGNYPERKRKLEEKGYRYKIVQRIVNEILGD